MNWLGCALLSALFAGLVAIFGKIGVRDIDSNSGNSGTLSYHGARSVTLVLARSNRINLREISPRAWLFITLAGLAGAASWLCYFRALQLGDASRVAPIDRMSVLVVVVIATLFLGEKLTAGVAFGALLVFVGSIFISWG